MQINAMEVLGNTAVELVLIRATCKVLDMRSKALFAIGILATMAASFACRASGMPEGLRTAIIGPLSFFALPLVFSRGPMRKRISRICLLVSASLPAEFSAAISYSLLSGQSLFPSPGATIPTSEYALIYASSILTSAITYEAVIACCMRTDSRDLVPLNLSVIALVLESYVFFGFVIIRVNNLQEQGSFIAVAALLWTLVSFAIAVSALEIAQREAHALRDLANQVAITRQLHHIKREIRTMTHSSSSVRRLRHDLANQSDVINELLGEGHVDLAERYVLQLQNRADELTEQACANY